MGNSKFKFADKFGYDSPLKEEISTMQNSSPPKIKFKCSILNIKIGCIVDINFILDGTSGWNIGYDHNIKLTTYDTKLKIYDDSFDVDKGWTFLASFSRALAGSSSIILNVDGKYNSIFSMNFVDEKSAFTRADKDKIIVENNALLGNDKVCFRVADKELAILLNDNSLILNNYANLTGFTRMDDYTKKGYVYKSKKFEQGIIWKRHSENGYKLKPYEFASGQSKCFSEFINSTTTCMGIHVYHFILLNGYHVLILLVDNTNNCKPKFKIIDQNKVREWENFNKLDNSLLDMTINNYNYACDSVNRKDINSSINLCKIKSN